MRKFLSLLIAAMFAGMTIHAVAAEQKAEPKKETSKKTEKKTEKK